MGNILAESLYKKQKNQFEKINDLAKQFAGAYCGTTILRDSIFGIVENYARKQDLALEILRYPFQDDELWAFTFLKKGTLFLCVNSELAMCKQIFAVAHELYHIHCYAENTDRGMLAGGSLLDAKTVDEPAVTREDLEANAFAGVLLMPDMAMREQVSLFGISSNKPSVDEILVLMELFALPYKAVVLRLFEGQIISESAALELLEQDSSHIAQRAELTGKAVQWQKNSRDTVYFGSLMKNLEYNAEQEWITESREEADRTYLETIKKGFQIGR